MAAVTRLGLYGGPRAPYAGFVAAGAVITLSGTITTATEADIVSGGATITLEIVNDTWVATVGDAGAITDALIAGIDSDGAEATGWDAVVKAGLAHGDVVRTSDTVVTITLPAFPTYDLSAASETITVTVPATALSGATETVAAPTFGVTAVSTTERLGGGRGAKRLSKYPRRVVIDGVVYWVNSAAEERQLLQRHQEKVEREALALAVTDTPEKEVKAAKVRVQRVQRRIEAVDTREDEWLRRLRDEDEEILMVVFH